MRFFGRGKSAPAVPSVSDQAMKLEERYLAFTASRLRRPEVRVDELRKLVSFPYAKYLGFAQGAINGKFTSQGATDFCGEASTWLLVGTPHISILYEDMQYAIGEFIVYISRLDSKGDLKPCVMVENVTPSGPLGGPVANRAHVNFVPETIAPAVVINNIGSPSLHAHPHCSAGRVAPFCMPGGMQELNQAIANGDIFQAYQFVTSALLTYNDRAPYAQIDNWPVYPR